MTRIVSIFGLIAGTIAGLGIIATIVTSAQHSLFLGYLVMLVALSAILVGVKQYRDQVRGGVIGFGLALLVGLGIAVVAGIAFTAVWEIYLALNHYDIMNGYFDSMLAQKRAAHVSAADYQKAVAEVQAMKAQYANPLYRLPETFIEIFPVGVLIALVSAALLRNPRFLPAKAAA
ncbi:MAG TPA: DUF4199 domain-containing protein [Rhizomicrobium sp.]|jgi:hypothetical protein